MLIGARLTSFSMRMAFGEGFLTIPVVDPGDIYQQPSTIRHGVSLAARRAIDKDAKPE